MAVRYDFSDFDKFVEDIHRQVQEKFDEVGQNAVEYAVSNGNYKNRTGNLRASNAYEATDEELILKNTADYASHVEQKGYDVLSGAYLNALNELGL